LAFPETAEAREKDRRDARAALEYAKDEGREEVRAELEQVIAEKDQEIEALRRKLREAGKIPGEGTGLPRLVRRGGRN
jgi:vacuolar-type H+-ATPase subunit I/STV1